MQNTLKEIEGLIIELGKAYKAAQFYPEEHPALSAAIKKIISYLQDIAKESEDISFSVTRSGFEYEGEPINRDSKAFALFAKEFFLRNINKVFFMHDIPENEMISFLKILSDDPKGIRGAGGTEDVMLANGIKSIWANEVNYEKMLEQKQHTEDEDEDEVEEGEQQEEGVFDEFLEKPMDKEELLGEIFEDIQVEGEEKEALSDLKDVYVSNKELFGLLRDILKTTDESLYSDTLNKIVNNCLHLRNMKKHDLILKVCFFLSALITKHASPMPHLKDITVAKLREIVTPDVTTLAIEAMIPDKDKSKYVPFFLSIGENCIHILLDYLAQKGDLNTRHNVSNVIARFGKDAFPIIEPYFADNKWYMVCGAISIVGKIGEEDGLSYLMPMLDSEDVRIQRETVKALGNIRSLESLELLTSTIKSGDKNLLKSAIISLGQLQFEIAIPDLINLTKKGLLKKTDIDIRKAAVIALGKTKADKAIPPLLSILRDISFLGKEENDELRILAAKSIGEIGGAHAIAALEIGRNSQKPLIKNICKEMLEKVDAEMSEEEDSDEQY